MKTQTKIVIRKLPKALTQEGFLSQIYPFQQFNYFRFCEAGKHHKDLSSCRVYIDFCSEDDMYIFKDTMENKLFTDDDGNQAYGIIEFAVYPKVPGNSKIDAKQNTLQSDTDFIKFREDLKETPKLTNIGTVEMNLEEIKNREIERLNTKTPLLEFISNMTKYSSKDRPRKDEFRRKNDMATKVIKKDNENASKNESKTKKSGASSKETVEGPSKQPLPSTVPDKIVDARKSKQQPQRRQDYRQQQYGNNPYDEEYDGPPKRGFDKGYRSSGGWYGGAYDGGDDQQLKGGKSGSGYYYGGSGGKGTNYYDYYGYTDYGGHQTYAQGPPSSSSGSSKNKRGGGKRPPAYSATRKD